MEKFFDRLLIASFLIIIFAVPVLTFTAEPKDRLYFENRMATKAVPFNKENYFSGEFATKAEKAFSDNVYRREDILRLYTKMNMSVLKRQEVNRVIIGKEGYLLPYYDTNAFDREKTDKEIVYMTENMAKLNDLVKENGGELIFCAIPAQFSLYGEKFPKGVCDYSDKTEYTRKEFLPKLRDKGLNVLDFKEILSQREDKDKLYFKTDHHFNIYGAKACYESIMEEINKTEAEKGKANKTETGEANKTKTAEVSKTEAVTVLTGETNKTKTAKADKTENATTAEASKTEGLKILTDNDLDFITAPNNFLGSMNRKLYGLYNTEDRFVYALPKEVVPFERYNNGVKDYSMMVKPTTADKFIDYESFIGGDVAEMLVDTHRPELPTLMIVGDSYTNALETLLYYSFDKTYALDFRYNKTKPLADYIKEIKPDYVVFVRDDTIYLSPENNGNFFELKEEK